MYIPSWKVCKQCSTKFFADLEWKKICLACWKENKGIKDKKKRRSTFEDQPPFHFQPKTKTIPADMLRRLIYLCHPDKHNQNRASHIATEWLLKQKD